MCDDQIVSSRNMFDQLSVTLHTTGNASPQVPVKKTAELYPNICFWTQVQYNQWTGTAKAHADTWWKLTYLELEEGGTVSDSALRAICKKVQGCWVELITQNMAPKSWGKASTSAKDLIYNNVYKSFPFLQLTKNNWKIEILCSSDYPGWVRNNLDDQGKWQVKQEDDTIPGEESVFGASKKRKAKGGKSKVPEKKIKSK